MSVRVKKAVILAGGKGTRMRPFTYEMPKPLIPVQDRPLVQYILDLLGKYNIRDVIFSIGYLGDKVKEHFGDGKKFGFNITVWRKSWIAPSKSPIASLARARQ